MAYFASTFDDVLCSFNVSLSIWSASICGIEIITNKYISLENEFKIAIRPSGTEPKIKYYLFGCEKPGSNNLIETKAEVSGKIKEISEWLVSDAHERVS